MNYTCKCVCNSSNSQYFRVMYERALVKQLNNSMTNRIVTEDM